MANESRICEVSGKPRAGKHFLRVKFNNSGNYSTILISDGRVNASNQLAWTSGSLSGNVWHEVRVEDVTAGIPTVIVGSVNAASSYSSE